MEPIRGVIAPPEEIAEQVIQYSIQQPLLFINTSLAEDGLRPNLSWSFWL